MSQVMMVLPLVPVTPVQEMAALETAVEKVTVAWCDTPVGTNTKDKIWRIRKYLILRQDIIMSFISVDDDESLMRR